MKLQFSKKEAGERLSKKKDTYKKYLDEMCKIYSQSESTESSYYPTLKNLLQDYLDFEKRRQALSFSLRKAKLESQTFS